LCPLHPVTAARTLATASSLLWSTRVSFISIYYHIICIYYILSVYFFLFRNPHECQAVRTCVCGDEQRPHQLCGGSRTGLCRVQQLNRPVRRGDNLPASCCHVQNCTFTPLAIHTTSIHN
jgi:hypothetical protein